MGQAYVCQELGLRNSVVVPVYTPQKKINAIKRFGAEVIIQGNDWNESFEHAKALSQESGAILNHPFDDDAVINGQGTIALEVLEQADCSFDYFIMSVGGGSMIASNSLVFKESPAIPGLLVCRRMEPIP